MVDTLWNQPCYYFACTHRVKSASGTDVHLVTKAFKDSCTKLLCQNFHRSHLCFPVKFTKFLGTLIFEVHLRTTVFDQKGLGYRDMQKDRTCIFSYNSQLICSVSIWKEI